MSRTSIRKILSYNTKFFRYQMNYTQEKLAEKSGLSPRYISDIETCRSNITLDKLDKVASVLKVNTFELLKERETQHLGKKVNIK